MSDLRAQLLASLHNFDGYMTLNKAMELVGIFETLYVAELQVREDKSYNDGHKDGYAMGKRDAEVPSSYEMDKLQRVYDFQKQKAQEVVKDAVQRHGTKRKIQVIKDVRNATGLGLKDSKDIVDAYVTNLTTGLADWEREILEAPHGSYFSNEPRF